MPQLKNAKALMEPILELVSLIYSSSLFLI